MRETMTEFVFGSTIAGGFLALSNPLAFQALLGLRYPDPAPKAQRTTKVVDATNRFEARRGASPAVKEPGRGRLAA
jgi:hypothetical protein